MFGIGAGNVELVARQPLVIFQHARHFHVVFRLVSENIGKDRRPQFRQRGQFFGDEGAHSHVLQADGIDHAGLGFIDARRGVPFDGLARQALHHQAAQRVEIHLLLKLHSIAERAGGRDHGVA